MIPQDQNKLLDVFGSVASQNPKEAASPLTPQERLQEAPDICLNQNAADMMMKPFSSVSASVKRVSITAAPPPGCPSVGACYQVTATPLLRNGRLDTKRDVVRRNTKRNTLTIPRLKPGAYAVSFHVIGRTSNASFKTKESPKRKITVRR